eukprot:TRINITY_DN10867_c0_g1_i1.p1 TRINITY_DN10867_c0_g1~~TRINITY_DN10867_c0_g1_i1.p1  ORF type:complete len:130 (+),score=26.23 TRINITY_DN10867_c0_g1_i1:2-391(+)
MDTLKQEKCINPCSESPVVQGEDITHYLDQLDERWSLTDEGKITRTFRMRNFQQALSLTNKIGELAEDEGHHPDFHIEGWNSLRIVLHSFSTNSLTRNDFIVAAKIDDIDRNDLSSNYKIVPGQAVCGK